MEGDSHLLFGAGRSKMPSIFGGKDTFDNSFFSSPFGSVFDSTSFYLNQPTASKGVIIEEINPESEVGIEYYPNEKCHQYQKRFSPSTEPLVEHPPDDALAKKNVSNPIEERETVKTKSFTYKKVTYGGVNGAYYTSSMARNTGSDGVVLEERKEADATTGQAAHRISRGLNDKGHSVTRMLASDGEVDTLHTLHNLEKDELPGFERDWAGNADKFVGSWKNGSVSHGDRVGDDVAKRSWDGWPFSAMHRFNEPGRSSGGRPKKVVTIHIE